MDLRFHRRVYDLSALRQTLEAYGEVARGSVARDGDQYYAVHFDEVDPDVAELLPHEFANYALFLTITGKQP